MEERILTPMEQEFLELYEELTEEQKLLIYKLIQMMVDDSEA